MREANEPETTEAPHPAVHAVREGEAPPAPRRPARGRKAFVVLGIVVGVMGLAIGGYALATAGQETTDDAQVESDVVPVAARAPGQVARVLVADNQLVHKGDLLLQLDDVDYAARVDQAQAELATAQAQADAAAAQEKVVEASATGGLRTARAMVSGSSVAVSGAAAQIEAAKAAVERAQAEARKAQLDLERARQLRAAEAVSQQRLDDAQVANDGAQAALTQARAALLAAEEGRRAAESRVAEAEGRLAQSSPIEAQIAAAHAATQLARAKVAVAEAALKLSQQQLSYTKVLAPDDGVVSKLTAHPGQLLAVGQPFAELVPVRTYVVANFKETQIGDMRPGDRAEVEVDAFSHTKIAGRVESLSGGTGARFSMLPPDNASGNFVKVVQRVPVRIEWTGPVALPLRAGLSATVTVWPGRH